MLCGAKDALRSKRKGRAYVRRPDNFGSVEVGASNLIRLPFVGAHVAAFVSLVLARTRKAALIGRQQMTLTIGAAIRVARVNRWASQQFHYGLCRATVIAQLAKLGLGVVQIARTIEVTGFVAAQVVALRG